MKPSFRYGIAALALLASPGLASAAGAASSAKASDTLKLTRAQEHTIWQSVGKQNTSMKTPAGFNATIGAKVPGKVGLHPLPADVASQVPAVKSYDYAFLDNKKLLIVNPMDKKVVDIITQ